MCTGGPLRGPEPGVEAIKTAKVTEAPQIYRKLGQLATGTWLTQRQLPTFQHKTRGKKSEDLERPELRDEVGGKKSATRSGSQEATGHRQRVRRFVHAAPVPSSKLTGNL